MGRGGRASGGLLRKTREKGRKEISAEVFFFFSGGGEKNRGIERKRSDRGEDFGWSFLEKGARWSPKQDRYFFFGIIIYSFFFRRLPQIPISPCFVLREFNPTC